MDDELRRTRRALHLVRALEQVTSRWQDPQQGLAELARLSGSLLDCPVGSVWVLDPDEGALVCLQLVGAPSAGLGAATPGVALSVAGDLASRAWKSGEPLVEGIRALGGDPSSPVEQRAPALTSGVAFPIVGARGPIGVISLLGTPDAGRDPELAGALGSIGRTIGNFIEQRRETLQRRRLSPREAEVLQLAADGLTGPDIAGQLVLSSLTVKTHFAHIYRKLGTSDRAGAVAEGFRQGLIR